ncbi:MAG: hypothetical protein ACK4YP_22135, partial [Myxococcota bacterium]
ARARVAAGRALEQLRAGPIVLWFFAPATYAVAEVWCRLAAREPDAARRAADLVSARQAARIVNSFAGTFAVATAQSLLATARLDRVLGKGRAAAAAAARAVARAAEDGVPYE